MIWRLSRMTGTARAAVVTLLALGLVTEAGNATPGVERLYVPPFTVDGATLRNYWLGEGIALLVADQLEAGGREVVAREDALATLEQAGLAPSAALTRATLIRVAEALEATGLVVGHVAVDGAVVTVRARCLQLDTGAYGPEVTETGPVGDLAAIAARLAGRLVDSVTGETPSPASSTPPASTPLSLEAFEAYVKALLDERPEARLRLLRTALGLDARFDRARLALWDVQTEVGRHADALATVRAVAPTSTLAAEARFRAALTLLDLRRHDEAFAELLALERSHPYASVYNNLGVVQMRRGAPERTGRPVYYFTRAADADPDDADVCFNVGYGYWLEQDHRAAVYWLREAVRRRPQDADAHLVLGAALASLGASTEAGRERDLAARLSARHDEWVRRGHPVEAAPRGLERVARRFRPVPGPRFGAALTAAGQRDAEAVAAFHLGRARQAFADGRDAEALGEIRRCLFLMPYNADAHVLLARLHRRGGRFADAVAAARMALWSRESAEVRLVLAEALLEAEQPDLARIEAERALQLDPSLTDARALLEKIDPRPPAK